MTRTDAIEWACANAAPGFTIFPLRRGRKHGIRIETDTYEVDILLLTEDGDEAVRILREEHALFFRSENLVFFPTDLGASTEQEG
jgi:hypothetical protein